MIDCQSQDTFVGQFAGDSTGHRKCGIIKYANGDIFQGEFKNDKISMGMYTKWPGITYKGDFNAQGKYHGTGSLQMTDGSEYTGEF